MPPQNGNNSFLSCWREVESAFLSGDQQAILAASTKIAVHFVRLEQMVKELNAVDEHGKTFDVQKAYEELHALTLRTQKVDFEKLINNQETVERLIHVTKGALFMGGAAVSLLLVIISMGIYIFNDWHAQAAATEKALTIYQEKNDLINQQQTSSLERIIAVQELVVRRLTRDMEKSR